jgi:pimeloyl-ACP methyl ester carboxylesterase
LLLHGQPGVAADWDRVRAAIGRRATTIAIDRPGWNGRGSARGIAGNAEAAIDALDRAGIDCATVVGHSFGAAVAASVAASSPQRVGRLVLVAPAANVASLHPIDYLLALPVAGYLLGVAALGGIGSLLKAQRVRRRLGPRLALGDRDLRAASRTITDPAAWRAFYVEQRALIRELPALEARLGQIRAPTTILAGTRDRIVRVSAARSLSSQIPGSELMLIDRAGHLLAQQHAGELAEAIAGGVPLG